MVHYTSYCIITHTKYFKSLLLVVPAKSSLRYSPFCLLLFLEIDHLHQQYALSFYTYFAS